MKDYKSHPDEFQFSEAMQFPFLAHCSEKERDLLVSNIEERMAKRPASKGWKNMLRLTEDGVLELAAPIDSSWAVRFHGLFYPDVWAAMNEFLKEHKIDYQLPPLPSGTNISLPDSIRLELEEKMATDAPKFIAPHIRAKFASILEKKEADEQVQDYKIIYVPLNKKECVPLRINGMHTTIEKGKLTMKIRGLTITLEPEGQTEGQWPIPGIEGVTFGKIASGMVYVRKRSKAPAETAILATPASLEGCPKEKEELH